MILTPRFVGPRFESEDYTNLGVVTAQIFFFVVVAAADPEEELL